MVLMDKGNIQTCVDEKDVALYEKNGYIKYEPEKIAKKGKIPEKEETKEKEIPEKED